MFVIPSFYALDARTSDCTEHDPNDPVRERLRTSAISNEREVAHVCFFCELNEGIADGTTRGEENEIARRSRHAYKIGGWGDIKVVPSVRRGATADKWPEMLAKSCTPRGKLFFTAAENERGREKGLSV